VYNAKVGIQRRLQITW